METTTFTMTTRVTGTDTNTYEIQRSWDENGKRALILELYPTITKDTPQIMDLSSLHLHNHASELELGSVSICSICNLYSTVFISPYPVSSHWMRKTFPTLKDCWDRTLTRSSYRGDLRYRPTKAPMKQSSVSFVCLWKGI